MVKGILIFIGSVAFILGVVGIFLPILPTTPFVLLAAWCFLKSSSRAHEFLRSQRFIGQKLKDWEERRAISRGSKIQALVLIALSLGFVWYKVEVMEIRIGVTLLLAAVSAFIATRPE